MRSEGFPFIVGGLGVGSILFFFFFSQGFEGSGSWFAACCNNGEVAAVCIGLGANQLVLGASVVIGCLGGSQAFFEAFWKPCDGNSEYSA